MSLSNRAGWFQNTKPSSYKLYVRCNFDYSFILVVSTGTKPAEDRFHTLLNERSRNGWVIYANYFHFKGDTARHEAIMKELTDRFPDYTQLKEAYTLVENGNYLEAKKIAGVLVNKDPYQADFLQIYGNIHGKLRQFEKAEYYYHKALKLSPYQPTIMNELGQLYMTESKYSEAVKVLRKAHWISPERTFITESLALSHIYLQHYDSASALADTLFMNQDDSPGGHLIKMTVALNHGDDENARFHFKEYLKYGAGRSDYNNIKEFYGYLNR